MADQAMYLNIPDDLYQRLKRRAEEMHRSVEEEALVALATSVPQKDELPHDWKELLDSMSALDDEALWQAAQNDLGRKANAGIRRLRAKRRTRGLTVAEQERLAELLRQEDKGMLIRAQALLLLKQRGRDIEPLLHLHEQDIHP
jgi:plasmid stability protein